MKNLTQKIIFNILLITLLASSFGIPQKTEAGGSVFNTEIVVKEYGLDLIASMIGKVMAKQLVHQTANWIKSGFDENENPLTPRNYGAVLEDAARNAGGIFLDDLTYGRYSDIFCGNWQFGVNLNLPTAEPFETRAACSFDESKWTVDDFMDDFSKGGWASWISISQMNNNPYGITLLAMEEKARRESEAAEEKKKTLEYGSGFLAVEKCVEYDTLSGENCTWQGNICVPNENPPCLRYEKTTPGALIEDQLAESFGSGIRSLELADEISETIVALATYSLSKLQEGITPPSKGTSRTSYQSFSPGSQTTGSKTTLTLCDGNPFCLAYELEKLKFGLYDYKITAYDSRFKPGIDNDDTEAYSHYKEIYESLGRNYDTPIIGATAHSGICEMREDDSALPRICDFGILSNGKNIIPDIKAGWPEKSKLWFLEILRARYEHVIDDMAKAIVKKAEIKVAGGAKWVDLVCRAPATETGDEEDSKNKRAQDNLKHGLSKAMQDISEIKDYFDSGGTYEQILKMIKESENSIKQLCPQAYPTKENYRNHEIADCSPNVAGGIDMLDLQYGMDALAEQILSLKNRMANKISAPLAIADRLDAYTDYLGSYAGEAIKEDDCSQNKCTWINPEVEFEGEKNHEIWFTDMSNAEDVTTSKPEFADGNMHCWVGINCGGDSTFNPETGQCTAGEAKGGKGDAPYVELGYTWEQCESIQGEYTGEDGYWYSERECKAYLTGSHANAVERCQISVVPWEGSCGFTTHAQVIDCLNKLHDNPNYSCSKSGVSQTCGSLGGTYCIGAGQGQTGGACPAGKEDLGPTSDCSVRCCR